MCDHIRVPTCAYNHCALPNYIDKDVGCIYADFVAKKLMKDWTDNTQCSIAGSFKPALTSSSFQNFGSGFVRLIVVSLLKGVTISLSNSI